MNIRSLALAPALVLALAFPALAERIPLNEISRYLNSLRTVTSEFTQVNPDGTISTGTVYLQRPGRARFEYNNDNTLMLASGGNVAIFDPKSSGGPQQYPLAKTPLSIILDANVNLGRANMVTGYTEAKNATVVTAQDPEHPEYGNIQMVFSSPTQLRQWVVTDDAGKKTTVILGELNAVGSIPASRFNIGNEIERRR
ncbi:LolA family protein [Paracoccus fistulariae]|uniref:Outer-membrane lipoprotein carrier protein LolA n=1 Tax=Paracoccus fistulariae TaxID=658446 RepID=A0ABY7SHG8_9RHOB|nr:outer membrane lipoprotein carrier protein LolA [Paracoccus fistulariae]MDB6180993.1 outer membrane lipoprotein carrier protein LolA [Paracoccus fistulariae]WCR06289.1 outer-membrane lipoprotein carrier protein LolA [Paracoccus fistulariae]